MLEIALPWKPSLEAAGYDRPAGNRGQSRSVVMARNGMVATSHPMAAQVGLDILKAGGNAADAAIAVNAMLGVVEPMSCGVGGDLFVVYWDAETQTLYGLNASGRSPYELDRATLVEKGLKEILLYGPESWTVPGCVDGWQVLADRFGTRSLGELLDPAIQTAENGFPVSEIIAASWKASAERLAAWPDSAETWLIDGKAPQTGQIFTNARLAETLRKIAKDGRDAFYEGDIAEEIVAFSEANGGSFTLKDFAETHADWVSPVSTNYRGYDVWELPPNGQGIAALQMLNILEAYNLAEMKHNSANYLHLFVEAKKLAFADRARFYADPDFSDVPVERLISKEYATRQRRRIDPNKASVEVPPGDPILKMGDTVYLTVVDKDRNCCSFIQSNYHGFGSHMTPGKLGFALQNRGALFSLDEEHPNRLEPHKRPFHTIIPAMVTKDGKPWFCFGVMGGDMQPQGHVQVLCNLIDFGMNVQAAGDAARTRHVGSAQPTGKPMDPKGGQVAVESGVSVEVVESLKMLGHDVITLPG
ncbi:MAG: gamma-glutamyltransferase, partial [Planctomycetaceae bacterium]|nr:gamma-glutamyltransferase [Planctomycetaceae bacterium]